MGRIFDDLACFIGKTVTIFTTSGGLSGAGFTGVLIAVTPSTVKLITDIGAPPSCPIGSACTGPIGGGYGYGYGYGYGSNCGCNNYGYGGYGYGSGCGCGGYGNGYGYGSGCGCSSYGYGGGCGCSSYGYGGGYGGGFGGGYGKGFNFLGSVTEIPVDRIASFTHNAI